ncbi:MAG: hydrogenase expression/formation protein HypE [Gammaproteobacteria bacterium]
MNNRPDPAPGCPLPLADYPEIVLAHGGGGVLTRSLIEGLFLPAFDNAALAARHDGAVLEAANARLAFTTDAYVVRPPFFPGGDIGSLAIHGTVNDLAMCGARPLWLGAAMILEEGFPVSDLERIVRSMRDACAQAGVTLVTGDTKVVDQGKGDGIYVTTTGVGLVEATSAILPARVAPGDAIILSGDVGRHGIAVMATREGLAFETALESDSAPLAEPVLAMLDAGVEVHCLRDLTRGGLATALVEIAETAGVRVLLEESAIPVAPGVQEACELLGLDPLYVANEGRMVVFVPAAARDRALEVLRAVWPCEDACVIGTVERSSPPGFAVRTVIGATRSLDMLSGEQLPRIC